MPEYGVTDKGFVLKRMDTILEEIHQDLSEGFGFDTRVQDSTFLDVLVTTFASQIADMWETAQDSYYAKYPSTATDLSLDHAVQFGGITRTPKRQTCYPLHCTGYDGTTVREGTLVATNTNPEIQLYAAHEFVISRDSFNCVKIKAAVLQMNSVYSITINGDRYSYLSDDTSEESILNGLKSAINNSDYSVLVELQDDEFFLVIKDSVPTRRNVLILSDNLTTEFVTTIANFFTEDYGRITLPNGIVTKLIHNVNGFNAVTNLLEPIYGRLDETDIELRQSYVKKAALRSNTMIDSIVSELLNNVPDVESASGYENDTDITNERGLPPHSIEIVVEGGEDTAIANAILKRKAGGIQTFGNIEIDVPGRYGDSIPIHFNRPEYLYTWLKITLHGRNGEVPNNYAALTQNSIMETGVLMVAGDNLLIQQLTEGIYRDVAGVTYIDIYTAHFSSKSYIPNAEDYAVENVMVTQRQKVLLDITRIEVVFDANS